MDDLITRIENASEDKQPALVRATARYLHERGRITETQVARCYGMCAVGAYESAALSLLSDGWCPSTFSRTFNPLRILNERCRASIARKGKDGWPNRHVVAFSSAAALALCAAILKARNHET